MLERLACFGGRSSRIAALPGAAFGVAAYQTLPEDDFDRQPLLAGDRFLFAADVRLDNRDELEAALGFQGRELADADILLAAWLHWEEKSLDRIVGDFAFVLFDTRDRKLSLVRDPLGQRPLFYTSGNDFVAFASMPNALVGTRGVPVDFNYQTLARNLSDMPAAQDQTHFRSVRRVGCGHIVTIQGGHVSSRDYWHPRCYGPSSTLHADYEAEHGSMLARAVHSRLRRRTDRIATNLSSGLDSTAVTAAAADLAGAANVIAYTAAPASDVPLAVSGGRFADESELAAEVAAYLGIRQVTSRDTGSAIAHLRSQAALYQQPYRNNINCGWVTRLSRAARTDGCAVMLTGDGGNLSLNSGSLAVLGDIFRSGDRQLWLQEAFQARRRGGARWTGILMNSFGYHLPRFATNVLERQFLGAHLRMNATYVQREVVEKVVLPALPLNHETRTVDSYADRLAVIRSYDYGNYNKGILAESGIDGRHPLLDRRAIEFSLQLPPRELFRHGRSRSLGRRALVGRIPQKILDMRERGYQGAGWNKHVSRDELFGMIEEIESSATARTLLDVKRIRTTIGQWDRINFDDPVQDLATTTFLPLALAGGLFIVEAERGFPSLARASREAQTRDNRDCDARPGP